MSKKINIMVVLIMCIVMTIPNVSYASNKKLGVALRERYMNYDEYNSLACKSLFIGDEYNAEVLMEMLNNLENVCGGMGGRDYIVFANTSYETFIVRALVFQTDYDLYSLFGNPNYVQFNDSGSYLEQMEIDKNIYDDDYIMNGLQSFYLVYNSAMVMDRYDCTFNYKTKDISDWTFNGQYTYNDPESDGYISWAFDDYLDDDTYAVISSNIPIYTSLDLYGNNLENCCEYTKDSVNEFGFSVSPALCCFNDNINNLVDINNGAIYTKDGYEDGASGGGSDGSEHHLYLKDFDIRWITKNDFNHQVILNRLHRVTACQPFISFEYTLDNYQSEHILDFRLQIEISDGVITKTYKLPLSETGITYLNLKSLLLDDEFNWTDEKTQESYWIYTPHRYKNADGYWGVNIGEIYPNPYDYEPENKTMYIKCTLIDDNDTSKPYSEHFDFKGSGNGDVDEDEIDDNDNPYIPSGDEPDYDGYEPVEPTPDTPSQSDGVNIVINNTNNNDDDEDDINLIIEDDDYNDDALREDIKDGFGLIDNLDTPDKADGFLGLVADFYSNTLDGDFKNIIMFGISSVVVISLIRAALKC